MANLGGAGNIDKSPPPNIFPSVFVHYIRGTQPQNMALRDCHNNMWQVKIEKHGDDWYFTDGWRNFIHDNMIKGGDVLLYEYASQSVLDFKILGSSAGCGGEVEHLNYRDQDGQDERMKVKSEDEEDADDWADDVEAADDFDEKPAIQRDDHSRKVFVYEPGTIARAPVTVRKRKNVDYYGAEVFSSGRYRQPLNPYFVTQIRGTRTNELYIPMDIVKCAEIRLPDMMNLVDARGRKYPTKRRTWKDGRTIFIGGWKSICKVNLAGKDDKIICEFVRDEAGDPQLNVTFIRPE